MAKEELKELLILSTKNVHFTFGVKNYVQSDGVAMDSLLGPVLGNIFMLEFESALVPSLTDYMKFWEGYVDDTIFFCKSEICRIYSFNFKQFGCEHSVHLRNGEKNSSPVLDVLLTRNDSNIATSVYRKTAASDLYLHWNLFAPTSSEWGTLKTLIDCAYLVCFSTELRKQEIQHLKQVFHKKNDYSKWFINQGCRTS